MELTLEKMLRERQKKDCCIICGTDLHAVDISAVISLQHFIIGRVLVCIKHIKS